MTITQIRYFVQVAENMNFTKAARQLYVAQQVVSKQVKRLEEELGFLLFERTAQGITLSAGGEKMYQYWKKIPLEPEAYVVGNRFMVAYPQNRYLQLKGFLKYLLEDTKDRVHTF